jgi:hypothetical protein
MAMWSFCILYGFGRLHQGKSGNPERIMYSANVKRNKTAARQRGRDWKKYQEKNIQCNNCPK